MTPPTTVTTFRQRTLTLAGLLLATFVAGSAELLAVGLLPLISAGLEVPVSTTGGLVSAYALGLALGGPMLAALTTRLDRRHVLVGSMTGFALLTVVPALVPSFALFLAARLLAGALQGLLMAAAFTTATSVVPPHRTGRAISVVMSGFAVSTVLGLPLGVLAGALLGWRGALTVAGAAALAAAVLLGAVAPSVVTAPSSTDTGWRVALSPRVLAVLALTLALFAAPGAVMTYLMPLLEQVVGLTGTQASAVLVAFGVANVAGSIVGGRLADADAARTLVISAVGLVGSFVALYLARGHPVPAVAAILAWAGFVSIAPPSIQYRAVSLAGCGDALVASLPASAGSTGIALGSMASGAAYAFHGASGVILTGVVIAAAGLVLALATRRLEGPSDRLDQQGDAVAGGPRQDQGRLGVAA